MVPAWRDSDGIRTARLVLRRWRSDDIAPFARINADPEVTRYLSGRPMSRQATADFVRRIRRHWDEWGYGLWAVEHLADRQLIGFIGLSHHRWYPDEVEVGWRLDSRYWGRGLATREPQQPCVKALPRLVSGGSSASSTVTMSDHGGLPRRSGSGCGRK